MYRIVAMLTLLSITLSSVLTPVIAFNSVEELYWWLRAGAYFTYLYTLPQPYGFVIDGYTYETSALLVNYTILSVAGVRALINLSLVFVNATVYELCKNVTCPVIQEMVNKTLHILLEIDLKTLGVYVNGSWIDEWLYLATINQLKGEAPKLVRVPSPTYGIRYQENTAEAQIIETFYEMLREELGEDLAKCILVKRIQDANIGCEGFPPVLGAPAVKPGEKVVHLRAHGGYRVEAIKPPPANFSFTIKSYTISGDRVARIGVERPSGLEWKAVAYISGYGRSILDGIRLGLLEVERNISIGYRRVYAFKVKFAPLELYAMNHYDEPEEEAFLMCLLYNPFRREVFLVTGFRCLGPLTWITGYYDYYTGVLLHLNVYVDDIMLMPVQAYTRLLGIEEVVRFPIRLRPIPPSELRAELVLVDTNISFERPIIGGAEGGFNLVHVAIVGVVISIGIIGVKVALSRRKRSLTT